MKGRNCGHDAPVLLAGVISYPERGEDWQEFKETALEWLKGEYGDNLVSVVEHQDEKHPHLHFYAVPKPGQAFNDLHQGRAASVRPSARASRKPPSCEPTTRRCELGRIGIHGCAGSSAWLGSVSSASA